MCVGVCTGQGGCAVFGAMLKRENVLLTRCSVHTEQAVQKLDVTSVHVYESVRKE